MRNRITVVVLLLVLIAGNVFLGWQWWNTKNELAIAKNSLSQRKGGEKILDFTNAFIQDVLKSEKEIDFETRLKLENKVRAINDPAILEQWQKFTDSKTEAEAQAEVTKLLDILITKVVNS